MPEPQLFYHRIDGWGTSRIIPVWYTFVWSSSRINTLGSLLFHTLSISWETNPNDESMQKNTSRSSWGACGGCLLDPCCTLCAARNVTWGTNKDWSSSRIYIQCAIWKKVCKRDAVGVPQGIIPEPQLSYHKVPGLEYFKGQSFVRYCFAHFCIARGADPNDEFEDHNKSRSRSWRVSGGCLLDIQKIPHS